MLMNRVALKAAATKIVFKSIEFPRRRLHEFRYEYVHKKMATTTLRNIEEAKGKLAPTLKKQSDDYAHDVLGWHGYSSWLYVYSAVAGAFKEGWIPDN